MAVVTFNGFVQTVDPTTGRDVRPHPVSVRVTRERFDELNLSRIDKRACLLVLSGAARAQDLLPKLEEYAQASGIIL